MLPPPPLRRRLLELAKRASVRFLPPFLHLRFFARSTYLTQPAKPPPRAAARHGTVSARHQRLRVGSLTYSQKPGVTQIRQVGPS